MRCLAPNDLSRCCGGVSFRARSQGQASIFVLVTAVILVIAALMVYNVGRLNITRIHLQNATDSAAYSGAVEMARAYNFAAYSNRAMVANQVAIAQMVGLASWSRYYCLIYTNSSCGKFKSIGTSVVIKVALELMSGGQPGVTILSGYRIATKGLFIGLNNATGPLVIVMNGLVKALSLASRGYYLTTLADLGLSTVNSGGLVKIVLQKNDSKAQLSTATLGLSGAAAQTTTLYSLNQIRAFIKTYKPLKYPSGDPNNRFHNTVMASRDTFSRSRSSAEIPPFTSLLTSVGNCLVDGIGFMVVSSFGFHGSTSLSTNNKTWSATDKSNGFPLGFAGFGICVIIVPTPIGPIPVPIPLPIPIPGSQGKANVTAATKNKYTLSASFYSGLQAYLGMANLQKPDTIAPTFTIFASRNKQTIATTDQLQSGSLGANHKIAANSLQTTDTEASSMMQVASSSGIYFVRPQFSNNTTPVAGKYNTFGNNVTLYASLFSPYWEPHLVPTPAIRSTTVGALQGGL